MKIQSLSVVVPNKSCINQCKFCVSRMHCEEYKNQLDENLPFFDLYLNDYLKRLQFARDNGCNTVMLTGTSEPQQNKKFLTWFGMFQRMLKSPFQWVEMQTTGVMLDEAYFRFLRNHVGVNLISLSISNIYDDNKNNCIIGTPDGHPIHLEKLCALIKKYDFSLRLSLNLTDCYSNCAYTPLAIAKIFKRCKELGADQVTFRVLYSSGNGDEMRWIKEHAASVDAVAQINNFIRTNGTVLGVLPYGFTKYSVYGMSVVVDDDCMAKREQEADNYKYLVLRPDCKLYSSWDDKASLIF